MQNIGERYLDFIQTSHSWYGQNIRDFLRDLKVSGCLDNSNATAGGLLLSLNYIDNNVLLTAQEKILFKSQIIQMATNHQEAL